MSKWIKCSERLPAIGMRVLIVSYSDLFYNFTHIQIGFVRKSINGRLWCGDNGMQLTEQPTLWKPLPVAPSYDAIKE